MDEKSLRHNKDLSAFSHTFGEVSESSRCDARRLMPLTMKKIT
jgi:hypothetical protein